MKNIHPDTMKMLKLFYDDNESGGSSRWLVSPDTFIRYISNCFIDKRIIEDIVLGIESQSDFDAGYLQCKEDILKDNK